MTTRSSVYGRSIWVPQRNVLPEEKLAAKALSDLLDDPQYVQRKRLRGARRPSWARRNIFPNPKPRNLVKYLERRAVSGEKSFSWIFSRARRPRRRCSS